MCGHLALCDLQRIVNYVRLKSELLNPIHHSCAVALCINELDVPIPKRHRLGQRRVHRQVSDLGHDLEEKLAALAGHAFDPHTPAHKGNELLPYG